MAPADLFFWNILPWWSMLQAPENPFRLLLKCCLIGVLSSGLDLNIRPSLLCPFSSALTTTRTAGEVSQFNPPRGDASLDRVTALVKPHLPAPRGADLPTECRVLTLSNPVSLYPTLPNPCRYLDRQALQFWRVRPVSSSSASWLWPSLAPRKRQISWQWACLVS